MSTLKVKGFAVRTNYKLSNLTRRHSKSHNEIFLLLNRLRLRFPDERPEHEMEEFFNEKKNRKVFTSRRTTPRCSSLLRFSFD